MDVTNSGAAAADATAASPGRLRVLVIEPAAGRRRVIRTVLVGDDRLVVVGMATDLADARDVLARARPDVLVADGALREMDGVLQLARLSGGLPVVTLCRDWQPDRGPPNSCEGEGGPTSGQPRPATDATLAEVLRRVADAAPHPPDGPPTAAQPPPPPPEFRWNGRIILIGASTGGVESIQQVLARFPADCPPTLIVQHMPPAFLASFAQRLGQAVAPSVRLARDGDALTQGAVLIAPGGACHTVIEGRAPARCRLIEAPRLNGHRPSVDVAFDSALPIAGQVLAVLLSGMGRDGAAAMRRLREAGGRTLAQDSASSVVWGMPGAAWREGGAEDLVPLRQMGDRMLRLCARRPPATVVAAPYG